MWCVLWTHADFKINDTEIGIDIYNGDSFRIEFDHYRYLTGTIDKNGEFIVGENTLNSEEKQIYEENIAKINDISQRLLKIHRFAYS